MSHPSLDDARFLPGAMVAERYRIIGLLGKGGMGEVYRADDLKLGQPVALKFLPSDLADNEDRLARFLHEVKIARQVAHPNVCRMYDVGEADGHHYLSMEYVDGEDLATLLRRIGRLPEDKAVQIARQLCAGLAAAHELGILHRDIKPANVMLDGRGRAKLTDFGLAGLAEAFEGADLRAGTPTYMAPEQIEGTGISVRSDVYSLGLVLYELFTGKRVFDGGTLAEVTKKQLQTTPTSPSSFMTGFDPAVERVLLQCLEKDPINRPGSALAVAAALPGGDPLAAALAAGETPSPEMVAAAGPQGGLRPGVAMACLLSSMVLWVAASFPFEALNPFAHLPLGKSYAALKENAREVAARLGYDESPGHSWAGFGFDQREYFYLVQQHGPGGLAEQIRAPGQAFLWMDYRQDDSPIVPQGITGRASWSTPAPSGGEVAMEIDLQGRLNQLRVTGSWRESEEEASEVDWPLLFEVAGLDIEQFEPVTPTMRPEGFADTRMAWNGTLPDYHDRPVRIEAAALDGKPIEFRKIISSSPRWESDDDQPAPAALGFIIAALVIFLVVGIAMLVGALFLTVRNLKLGRGDRRGAFRVAAFVFTARTLHWALAGDHVAHPIELLPLAITLSGATALALSAWIVYMAIEPYVRRLWPESLVSWTRVLAGRFRDPMVGRDILIGCTAAQVSGALGAAIFWAGAQMGVAGIIPIGAPLILMRGGRYAVGQLFASLLNATAVALAFLMIFLLLRMVCRKTWITAIAFGLLLTVVGLLQLIGLLGPAVALYALVAQAVGAVTMVLVLVRFGLLALVSMFVVTNLGNLALFLTTPSSPYFGLTLFVTAVAFALMAYGWHTSLAGRPIAEGASL